MVAVMAISKFTVFDQGVHVDTIIITDFEDGIELQVSLKGRYHPIRLNVP